MSQLPAPIAAIRQQAMELLAESGKDRAWTCAPITYAGGKKKGALVAIASMACMEAAVVLIEMDPYDPLAIAQTLGHWVEEPKSALDRARAKALDKPA